MRKDNRPQDALREVRIIPDQLEYADGSALIEMGKTRVLVAATIEEKVPSFLKGKSTGWVTAEYAMLPRSTAVRSQRERTPGRTGPWGSVRSSSTAMSSRRMAAHVRQP
jgi:ribonuclease PH